MARVCAGLEGLDDDHAAAAAGTRLDVLPSPSSSSASGSVAGTASKLARLGDHVGLAVPASRP